MEDSLSNLVPFEQEVFYPSSTLEIGLTESSNLIDTPKPPDRGKKKIKASNPFNPFQLDRYPVISLGRDLAPQASPQVQAPETSTPIPATMDCLPDLPDHSSDTTSLVDMDISGVGILPIDTTDCEVERPVQLRNIFKKRKIDMGHYTSSPRALHGQKTSSLDITLEVMQKLKRALVCARKSVPGDIQIKLLDAFATIIDRVSELEYQLDRGEELDSVKQQERALEQQKAKNKHENEITVLNSILAVKEADIGLLNKKVKDLEELLSKSEKENSLLKQGVLLDEGENFYMDTYPPLSPIKETRAPQAPQAINRDFPTIQESMAKRISDGRPFVDRPSPTRPSSSQKAKKPNPQQGNKNSHKQTRGQKNYLQTQHTNRPKAIPNKKGKSILIEGTDVLKNIQSKIKIQDLGVNFQRIKETKKGGVIITADSEHQINILKMAISQKMPEATVRKTLHRLPRINVHGVHKIVGSDKVAEYLASQNQELCGENIRVVKCTAKKDTNTFTLEVSPRAFQRIQKKGNTLSIWFQECPWENFFVDRCFNCLNLDHRSSDCKSKKRCHKCGNEHDGKDCTAATKTCPICLDHNKLLKVGVPPLNTVHSAFDTKCSFLGKKQAFLKSITEYACEEVLSTQL